MLWVLKYFIKGNSTLNDLWYNKIITSTSESTSRLVILKSINYGFPKLKCCSVVDWILKLHQTLKKEVKNMFVSQLKFYKINLSVKTIWVVI